MKYAYKKKTSKCKAVLFNNFIAKKKQQKTEDITKTEFKTNLKTLFNS